MSGMGGASGASAMQTLRYPTLAFVFALILIGYSIWDIDQLSGRRYSTTPARVSLAGRVVPAMAGAGPVPATLRGPQATAVAAAAAPCRPAPRPPSWPGPRPADRGAAQPPAGSLLLSRGDGRLPDRDGGHHGPDAAPHNLGARLPP